MKFEGHGSLSAYSDTNELLGLNGRWWDSGNQNDAYYWANKDTSNIIGYLVFDYFTTDSDGNFEGEIKADASYHVLYCDDDLSGNGDLYQISDETAYDGKTLKCDETTAALCPSASVFGQIERPSFSELPEGTYENVILVLNEESFHVSCGTWTTAMTKEIDFEIDYTQTCGNGILETELGEECDDGNNANGDGCSEDCNVETNKDSIKTDEQFNGYVDYQDCGEDFSGTLYAHGLETSHRYQLKIEGKPTCLHGSDGNDWSNEQLGLQGRFWCKQDCPCTVSSTWGGCNIDSVMSYEDAREYYLDHKDDPGFCAVGYLLFDCGTSDSEGNLEKSLSIDAAYETCSSVIGSAELPEGDYEVSFLLGEDFSPWGTLGPQYLDFTIGTCGAGDIPEFSTIGAALVLAAVGVFVVLKRKK
ncbi:hypothetical protein GF327_00595 [Candidatus Woesearchaeota archaeon]|nr:hypothetical protein [Candidatus Woesearchaeota archaeon]